MLQSTLLRAPTSTRARRYLSEFLGRAQMSLRLIFVVAGGALKAVRPVRSFALQSRRQFGACTPVVRFGNFIGEPYEIGAAEHIVRMSIKWCYRAHCMTTLCEALAVLDAVGTRKF